MAIGLPSGICLIIIIFGVRIEYSLFIYSIPSRKHVQNFKIFIKSSPADEFLSGVPTKFNPGIAGTYQMYQVKQMIRVS